MAKLKWVVRFEVDESWVADGFNLTKERAHDMLARAIGGAYNHELKAVIVERPLAKTIRKLQGYNR